MLTRTPLEKPIRERWIAPGAWPRRCLRRHSRPLVGPPGLSILIGAKYPKWQNRRITLDGLRRSES